MFVEFARPAIIIPRVHRPANLGTTMSQFAVEITDSNRTTILVNVELPPYGKGHWEVASHRFLRLQNGVVDTGDRGSKQGYIGLYGSAQVDDKYLVMHLDDFLGDGGANTSGTGMLYNHDNRLMVPGPLSWKLA